MAADEDEDEGMYREQVSAPPATSGEGETSPPADAGGPAAPASNVIDMASADQRAMARRARVREVGAFVFLGLLLVLLLWRRSDG